MTWFQHWVRFLVRVMATVALVAVVVFWVFPLVPRVLSGLLAANSAWVDTAARPLRDGLTEELMQAAVRHGIIRVARDGDRIEILDEGAYRAAQLAGETPPEGAADPDTPLRLSPEAVFTLLSRGSGAGPELRAIIGRANIERTLLAVRDRGLSPPCAPGREAADCPVPVWSLVLSSGGPVTGDPLPGSAVRQYSGTPEPRVFAGLAARRDRVNGPWAMTTGVDSGDARLSLVPAIGAAPPDAEVVIEVIGRDIRLPPRAEAEARLTHYCLDPGSREGAARALPCAAKAPPADRVALHAVLPAGLVLPDFRIEARPIAIPLIGPDLTADLAAGGPERLIRVPVNDELSILCLKGSCWPELAPRPGERRLARDHSLPEAGSPVTPEGTPPDEVSAAVEAVAAELAGNPFLLSLGPDRFVLSDLAADLGMQPLLGHPTVASGSLIDFFTGLPPGVEAADFVVSFEPAMQAAAQAVLSADLGPDGSGYVADSLLAARDDVRRAAIVLVDLTRGTDHGAVRAAAIFPPFDPGISDWNLRALGFGPLSDNPLSPPAWSGIDAAFQPGSTMKILSALSLIHSAAGASPWVDRDTASAIADILRGADPATLRDLTGLDVAATGAALNDLRPGAGAFVVGDRGNRPIALAERAKGGCKRGGEARLGLCEAIAASSNMFFAALALFENRILLDAIAAAPDESHEVSALGRLFRHFGIERSISLVRLSGDAGDANPPRAEAALLPSAPGLRTPGTPEVPDIQAMAVNSYGQNVFVTPVVLASVAGAIGTGGWVDPFIARSVDAVAPVPVPVVPASPLAQDLLELLRDGMKAVLLPNGTGHGVFVGTGSGAADLASRVWAKTGTATIGARADGYTHWFVGWVNDPSGAPRYAFACAISHVAEDRYPCIRATAKVLLKLQEEGRL